MQFPQSCSGVLAVMLNPAATRPESAIREAKAGELAVRFLKNSAKFKKPVAPAVRNAGPIQE